MPQVDVPLGLAENYVVFADTGIASSGGCVLTGNIGVGPGVTSTAITGFALVLDGGGTFSTSSQVVGNVYAHDYAAPTPTEVSSAADDMLTAYNDAAGRPTPDFTNFNAGSLDGQSLAPGLYNWTTGVTLGVSQTVTLTGSATDVYVFQISGVLSTGATSVMVLGDVLPSNIFWQCTSATVGVGAEFYGIVLASTTIAMGAGAFGTGRLLAQTNVALDTNTFEAPSIPEPVPTVLPNQILKQVDFFRDASARAVRNARELRSVSPNSVNLCRPTGWVVVVAGGSTDPCYMYVAINDTGSWQRIDAGTGTLGT